MTQPNSLDDLLIDEEEFNESLLVDVLAPYLRIGSESGAFVPREEFEKLDSVQKTAAILLYRKAAYELDRAEEQGASPKDIAEVSGINHNTVKTAVRKLDDMDLVVNEGGKYSIPTYNYDSAQKLIEEGEE